MKSGLVFILVLALAIVHSPAQSLADVLSSIQERKRAVEQSGQILDHLPSVRGDAVTVRQQSLIEWDGLGSGGFPDENTLNSLTIDAKVALLNQAILEFRELQGFYVNLRKEDLSGGGRIGVIRPYLLGDFPDHGRVDESNFHSVLAALARDVRRLSVLPWPLAGMSQRKTFYAKKFEVEVIEDGEMTGLETLEVGESVAGWEPDTIHAGSVDPTFDSWEIASSTGSSAWGSFLLERMEFSARSDIAHLEDPDYGSYDRRILELDSETTFHSQVAAFSKVPGRSDQVGGRVSVVVRNEWSPVDMDEVSINAPNSWDASDSGYTVAFSEVDPASTHSFAAEPEISVNLDWVNLGLSNEAVTLMDGLPFGYDATKEWLEGGSDQMDPDWRVTWERHQGIGPAGIAGNKLILFRRQLHGLFAPTFEKGLDGVGKGAKLDLSEKFSAPPAGDGMPLLHPEPGVLLGIPVGVGLHGCTTGFVGLSPCEQEAVGYSGTIYPRWNLERLTTRFDYAASLRFIGPAEDFHIVYASSRDESARGEGLPDEAPTQDEMIATGKVEFFDAWDTPRLRQVISRDLFIDITPVGHFKNLIKVYRRPLSGAAVDREPGKLATPPGSSYLIRTIVIENPDAIGSPYIDAPEKIRVTDGSSVYEVSRTGFPEFGDDPDPAISFKLTDNGTVRFSKVISFPASGQAAIDTQMDGNVVSAETIQDADWIWHEGNSPLSRSISSGGQSITVTNTFSAGGAGSQGGRYPTTSTITFPDEPTVVYTWHSSGRFAQVNRGNWATEWNWVAGELRQETRLNGGLVGTRWTAWNNGTKVVKVTSSPDGVVTSSIAPQNDWSQVEYGDGTGSSLPGLPLKLTRKDGSGVIWTWTETGGGATRVEIADGLVSGESVTRGRRSVVEVNARGYTTAVRSYLLQGGSPLQVAGRHTPGGQFTNWGAPTKIVDFRTGQESSVSFDGQRERPVSSTDFLGNVTAFSGYDAFDRPHGYSWNGHGGSAAYNVSGFGVATTLNIPGRVLARSVSYDARGRVTGGSVTAGGISDFEVAYAVGATTLTSDNSVTGASSSRVVNRGDGSFQSAVGDTLAHGGISGGNFVVEDGLIRSTTRLQGLTSCYRTTWTDAWGRMRKVTTSGTGGGADTTTLHYSSPASLLKRVETRHASGRRWIQEIEPWSHQGVLVRKGIDLDQNGVLDGEDRFFETQTSIQGNKIQTTLEQTGQAQALVLREYFPATGEIITTLLGGEEVITEDPDIDGRTCEIRHERNGGLVMKRTLTLNHLGQATEDKVEGTGIAESVLSPTFRDDGSVVEVSLSSGGATTSVTFSGDGRLSGFSHPLLGALSVSHGFAGGSESLTIHGTTASRALDGSGSALAGAGVMDRNQATTVVGGQFEEKITPATGSPTSILSNPAGAKVLHDYAEGPDRGMTWLAGGLPHSVSLGRGGASVMAYSGDGARDLVSITWPTVSSAGFPSQPFYGSVVGFPERDAAGNITRVNDPSGSRALDYEKNRLTVTDWTSGELNPYKVVRQHDARGRLEAVTVHRNGAAVHTITPGYTGLSDEISGMTTAGFSATVLRDAAGRYVTGFTRGPVTQRWVRGTAGRLTAADTNNTVNGAPWFNYTGFDNRGRRETVATAKGNWTYGYRNGAGGDGQLVSATSTGNQLGNFSYSVDGIGRRNFGNNQQDALNRFLAIQHPQAAKKLFLSADPDARLFASQGVGALTELTPFVGSWIYPVDHPGASGGWVPWHVRGVLEDAGDPGAHPDAVAEFSGHLWFPPTAETFTFDEDGNREGSSLWDYGWDGRNKLVRARTKTWNTAPEGWELEFDYDAEGRRFKKTVTRYAEGEAVDHKVIYFVWDGWDLLFERHEDGNGNSLLERRYVWGPDIADGAAGGAGGLLLMRETRGQTSRDYYPLYDGSGHVMGLADGTGKLVAEYWWGPFGELIEAKGEMAQVNPWRYATKYHDAETGLYYFGHRYYDPVSGQFLSREPLGESESLNLYSYCHNDPVNKVDVLGLSEIWFTPTLFAENGKINGYYASGGLRTIPRSSDEAFAMWMRACELSLLSMQVELDMARGTLGGGAEAREFGRLADAASVASEGAFEQYRIYSLLRAEDGTLSDELLGDAKRIARLDPKQMQVDARGMSDGSALFIAPVRMFVASEALMEFAAGQFSHVEGMETMRLAQMLLTAKNLKTLPVQGLRLLNEGPAKGGTWGAGGSGYTLNPFDLGRKGTIFSRAEGAGITVDRSLAAGQSGGLVGGVPTMRVQPFSSSTVAIEEYLHARFAQRLVNRHGAEGAQRMMADPAFMLQQELRLKSRMIGAGERGVLGSGPLKLNIDFLRETRAGYQALSP